MQCGTFGGDWFDFEDSVYFVLKITNPNYIYVWKPSKYICLEAFERKRDFLIFLVTNQL